MYQSLDSYFLNSAWMVPFFPFFAFILISIFTIKNKYLSAFISITAISFSTIYGAATLYFRIIDPSSPPILIEFSWISINTFEIPIGMLVNNLSSIMLFIISFIATLIQIYSISYMENEEETGFSKYYAYMSLFAASMLALVISPNFFQLYVFWELVGLCSYLLIGFWYKKKKACEAAKKAFIVTRFGDLGFLIGIIMLFLITKSFSFNIIPDILNAFITNPVVFGYLLPGIAVTPEFIVNITLFLIFCGAIGKSAMFPLHVWLPDAMEGPTPVSALIHAATMVAAGVFMVAQTLDIFMKAPQIMLLIAYIGGFTAFFAASIGVVQDDIKRVLAYSTISQLGNMMLALGLGGYVAGTFHLFTHAFFKALLFLCAGSVIHALHTNNIWEMGKLKKCLKITSFTFLVGCLSLAGIPPFSGFWSKDLIIACVSQSHHPVLIFFSLATVFLTSFYIFRVYFIAFSSTERFSHRPQESFPEMTVPLIILAVFSTFIGFIATPFENFYANFILVGKGMKMDETFHIIPVLVSVCISLFGIGTAYILYDKEPEKYEKMLKNNFKAIYTVLNNKYWIDEFWEFIVKRIVFLFGAICSFIDEKILNSFVKFIAMIIDESGKILRYEESGIVQQYCILMAISVAIILLAFEIIGRYYSMNLINSFSFLLQSII